MSMGSTFTPPFLMESSIMTARRFRPTLVLAAAIIVLAGCSQETKKVTVNGTISYKGQPLESGIIQFVAADGGSYSAASIQPGGKFVMTDVVPGEVKVAVISAPGGSGSSSGAETAPRPRPVDLPDKYRDASTSGLKYTITPDTSELEIKIP
jgi:hypothetical protein